MTSIISSDAVAIQDFSSTFFSKELFDLRIENSTYTKIFAQEGISDTTGL